MEDQRAVVRDGIASCLTAVLGSDQYARRTAEDELKALEVTEGQFHLVAAHQKELISGARVLIEKFGVILVEMTASEHSPVQYRQLASIILKQYVESHWNKLSEKFQEPEILEKMKARIRGLLPLCLTDPHSKVRAAVAYAISTIAYWDWPEHWPDLFDKLTQSLGSEEPNAVHGSLCVLTEFCSDVSHQQVPHIARVILPHLLKVIIQADLYCTNIRVQAVHVYTIISEVIFTVSMEFPEATNDVLFPSLTHYIATFMEILKSELPSNTHYELRKEVIMALCQLLRSFPSALLPHIMAVVTPIWNILTRGTRVYLVSVINCEDDGLCGEPVGQEAAIFAVFEFISALGESSHFQELLPPIFPQLIYLLITHLQITHEQCTAWLESVNQFVDEDENELSYSIRLSALALIHSFTEEAKLAAPCYSALMQAISKHLQEAPVDSSANWWKIHEACVLAASVVVEGVKTDQIEFDVVEFAERVILPDIAANSSVFLSGRCLWLSGKMASLLNSPLLLKVMELVGGGLQPSKEPVLRVLAAKAAFYLCSDLKSAGHAQLLEAVLPEYLKNLCQLANESPEDVVFLVVDSLQLVAKINFVVTAQCCSDIVPLAIALFLQYSHDPGILSCVEELFEALAFNTGCHTYLHTHFFPVAMDILGSVSPHLPLGLVAAVLDVLQHVVRGCGVEGSSGIPQSFIEQVFPRVVKQVLDSADSAILQNGGECVRAFVSVAVEQLAVWRDVDGRNGLQYVVQTILHLLDPLLAEFSASYVGKLIIVFMKKVGNALGTDLELLLRAVLSKMQSVGTSSVMQSLLLVFVRLIHSEMESVLSFLSNIPDPSGKPALHYVLSEWCTQHPYFYGVYESKVSTLALCQLLSHCISSGDQRLTNIVMAGEAETPEGQGIQTRSQRAANPPQWTEVSLPVKIVKLLVSDLQHHIECADETVSSDSECEGIEGTLAQFLTQAQAMSDEGGIEWEMERDPDLIEEPVMKLDTQAHITDYLKSLVQQPCFTSISTQLTSPEQQIITNLQIAT